MKRLYGQVTNYVAFGSGAESDRRFDFSEALRVLRDFPAGQIRDDQLREVLDYLQQNYDRTLLGQIRAALNCEGAERAERYRVALRRFVEWLERNRRFEFADAVAGWH